METAIVAAAIPYIVTAAQILGGISGGLNIIDHFSHKPDPTKKILAAVAEAETHILDAIHTETLNEHLLHISTAETWWRDTACKDIFDYGLKWNTVQPGGALTGMEDEMTRRIVDVDYAMTYLEENPLPSTANSYRILLGGHYLLIFMRAVQVAITWIRASQKAQEEGQVPPAPETLVFTEDGGLLYRAVMHVDKWTDQYKMHRAQRLGIRGRKIDTWRIVSEEIPDLIRNTSRYMWYYSIESDVGGDELMDTLKPAWLGEFPDPINSAAQQSLAMGHIEEAWGGSLEGGQTEKVFRTEWGAIREASAINSSTM